MRTAVVILVLLSAAPAFASGVHTAGSDPLEIREEHVRIVVREGVAEKHVRLVLHNPSPRQTEAELFFDLEPDEGVERFLVKIGGKPMEAELLDAEKAKRIYEEIVRKQKDPSLLELHGKAVLRVRVFPIAPQSTFDAELELVQPLKAEDGLVRLVGTSVRSAKPLAALSCTIDLEHRRPVRNVFSPTHEIEIQAADRNRLRVTCERKNVVPLSSFILYYTIDTAGVSVLGRDGYFMLTITPPDPDGKPLPRDVVFAVDTSGSMLEHDKMEQVKKALRELLPTLTEQDRFNLVTYSTEAARFRDGLVNVSEREAALKFVDALRARGGTNIEEALKLSLDHRFRPEAVPIVLFLTDGTPTIGERDTQKLAALARKDVRIFCCGVGFDINTQLLDILANENGGDRLYIHPKEDASVMLKAFAKKLDAPILVHPKVEIDGATEIYPKRLPDVFKGGQLVLFGRAKGKCTVVLKAGHVTEEYEIRIPDRAKHDFVPRLWAIRKIDYLMDAIRTKGTDKELVDEIVRLSKQFMIVTPYTSFLITEDTPEALSRARENFEQSYKSNFNGEREWGNARNQSTWRGADCQEAQNHANSEALGRDALALTRQAGMRNFVQRGDNWSELDIPAGQKVEEVAFGSEEYFRLLAENADNANILALGKNVTFRCNDRYIAVR